MRSAALSAGHARPPTCVDVPTLRTITRDWAGDVRGTATRAEGASRGCETYDLEDDSGRTLDFHWGASGCVDGRDAVEDEHGRAAWVEHRLRETWMGAYQNATWGPYPIQTAPQAN